MTHVARLTLQLLTLAITGAGSAPAQGTPATQSSSVVAVWALEDAYWKYVQAGDVPSYITLWHEHDAALANHVPESVLLLLFGFAVLTSGVLGYGNGLSGTRALGTAAILALLITLVILVIGDLDRPRRGLIQVSQESMINLQKSLEAPK